ncbi:hypothetical protein Hanom_Chr10g00911951 [Helianthus anomalus]
MGISSSKGRERQGWHPMTAKSTNSLLLLPLFIQWSHLHLITIRLQIILLYCYTMPTLQYNFLSKTCNLLEWLNGLIWYAKTPFVPSVFYVINSLSVNHG